jgi:hypothetical protein
MEFRSNHTWRIRGATLALATGLLLAACGGSSAPAASGAAPSAGGPVAGAFGSSAALTATIPTRVLTTILQTGGANAVALYTDPQGPSVLLATMAGDLKASPSSIFAAAGADQGGKIQIVAGQFQGVDSAALQAEVIKLAKGTDPNVVLTNPTIGGKPVTSAAFPGSQVGPTIAYIKGDTVYFVRSSDPALTEDAVKQLP